ncbi:MAG: GNAT family N-acetyltransferase [Corallococcus sp.]|nr:GNAT family N-acetyltransferase [Corallococcus sp.]
MKQVPITKELLDTFRGSSQTLIMEGYCKYFSDVTVYTDGNGYATVAVTGEETRECCISGEDVSFAESLITSLNGQIKFCGVSPVITEYLRKKYRFEWETNCYLYVWNGKPLACECKCEIRPIDATYAAEISAGTPYGADIEDIIRCIAVHPSAAAYVDGKPVCWCLLHMEGSLGMLYTLPRYRRQGYALEVMTALTDKVIERGDIPFAYIVRDNVASLNLACKYNLEEAGKADYFQINLQKN